MSLQLIIGRAGSGKTSYCYEQIEQALAGGADHSLIMMVPEQFNLQTQQALAYRIYPGLLKVEVQSFNNLALRIFGELGGPKEPIVDDLGRLMILRKIIEENQKDLILFQKSGRKVGFMESLNRLITEFEQYRITPDTLEELYKQSESSPALQGKLHDIGIIYAGFMDYIEKKFLCGSFAAGMDEIKKYPEGLEKNSGIFMRIPGRQKAKHAALAVKRAKSQKGKNGSKA